MTEKGQVHSSSFDGRPCREATIDDIDIDLFKNEYLPKAVSPVTLAKDKRNVIQQLASLRLFDTRFNCPTYAGVLLLGHDPQYFIPGAYIQYGIKPIVECSFQYFLLFSPYNRHLCRLRSTN